MKTKLLSLNPFEKTKQRESPSLGIGFDVFGNLKKLTPLNNTEVVNYGERNFEIKLNVLKVPNPENSSISETLINPSLEEKLNDKKFSDDTKFSIVLQGLNGEYSIAEICRRENITQETFLQWSKEFLDFKSLELSNGDVRNNNSQSARKLIKEHSGDQVLEYFDSYIDEYSNKTFVTIKSNILGEKDFPSKISNFICLSKINNVRYINKYFENINSILPSNGLFIGCLESYTARKERKKNYKVTILNDMYFALEFLCKRICPKLNITKKHYFNITKGNDRLLSKAEGLGRLVSCGFKIMDFKSINGLIYFVVKKADIPKFDMNPSYGPVYKMPRIGKNGKIIKVYKFRTMHPYSEYIQDYVVNAYGYADSGKPANDFRIPFWGKTFRKYWIDELPQLINVLKGDMKLVGIRPVSERYFQDIPKEMQKLRLTQKPGCIPPYVALNRKGNVLSVLQAEKEYLEEKIRNPYLTDTKYFCKAMYNIIVNSKRSA